MGQVFAVFVVVVGVAEIVACIKHIQNGYLPTWAPRRVITDPKWRQKQLSCDIIKRRSGGVGEIKDWSDDNKGCSSLQEHQLEYSQNNLPGESPSASSVKEFIKEAERILLNNEYIADNIELDDKIGRISNENESQIINQASINTCVNNNNNLPCELIISKNETSTENYEDNKILESKPEQVLESIILNNELKPNLIEDENFNKTEIENNNLPNKLEECQIIEDNSTNNNNNNNINNENEIINSKLPEHEVINENQVICSKSILHKNNYDDVDVASQLESDKTTSSITTNDSTDLHNDSCSLDTPCAAVNKEIESTITSLTASENNATTLDVNPLQNKTKNEIFESVIDSLLNDSTEIKNKDYDLIRENVNVIESRLLEDNVKNEVNSREIQEDVEACEISKNTISEAAEERSCDSSVDPTRINENYEIKDVQIINDDVIAPVIENSCVNTIEIIESEDLSLKSPEIVDVVDICANEFTIEEESKLPLEDKFDIKESHKSEAEIEVEINKSQLFSDESSSNDVANIESEIVSHIDVNGNSNNNKVLANDITNEEGRNEGEESYKVEKKEENNTLEQQVEVCVDVETAEIPRESQITIPQDIESVSRKEKIINLLSGILTSTPAVQENSDEINQSSCYENANEITDIIEETTETHEKITKTEITDEDVMQVKRTTSPNKLRKELLNEEIKYKNNGINSTTQSEDGSEIIDNNNIEVIKPDFENQVSVSFCDSPIIIPDQSRLTIKDPPPFEPSTPPPSPVGDEITNPEEQELCVINAETPDLNSKQSQSKLQSDEQNNKASTSSEHSVQIDNKIIDSLSNQASTSTSSQENSKPNNDTASERVTIPMEMKNTLWLIFSGEYTKAMSKDWHSGHFCCWQCDESLTGQRYVLRDDHPYCIKCYESVFANTCEECNKTIGIDSKDLSYKDKHWHEVCFLCTKCRVSLVDKQFGSKADKIYCGNCYDSQFASRCDGCGEIFRAGTKKMEYKTRQWHEKCFCCCVCKSAIGTKSFIPREQEIYCAGCYEEKFATRCVKCNKIITTGGVTYKNEPWHRECFTCTNCNTSLAGQRFTSRDEKPYCAECFGELFAKRCTSCSKPITGIGGTRFISFEDRHWHNDCFICATCKTSLVGRGFITDADDIICPECAKQKLM